MDIYSDGGSRGNPGLAACAFVVCDSDKKVIYKESKFLGVATNNVAEYEGLLLALKWLLTNNANEINFYMDSELIIKQFNGQYKVKDKNLKKYFDAAKEIERKINSKITFCHISRNKNKIADGLVNEELDRNKTS